MGDPRAVLDSLYREHHRGVAQFVRSRLGSTSDAEDACQDVWAVVARNLKEGTPPPSRAWIFGVARNKTVDVWRKRGAGVEALDSQVTAGGALASMIGVRTPATPTRDLSRAGNAKAVRAALARLHDDDRELLELRFVHGLKPREIAEMLDGVDANAISQRVVRATRRLRDALAADS